MARRASKSPKMGGTLGIVAGVLVILLVVSFLISKRGKTSASSDLPQLDVLEAVEDANSLRGNEYQVEGMVQSKEVRDTGAVVFLRVKEGGLQEFIGIKVPNDLKTINIEREKRYLFSVVFEKGGIARALSVERL